MIGILAYASTRRNKNPMQHNSDHIVKMSIKTMEQFVDELIQEMSNASPNMVFQYKYLNKEDGEVVTVTLGNKTRSELLKRIRKGMEY